MVYYVEPIGKSKEKWLRDNATEVERAAVVNFRFEDSLSYPVILICNGASNEAIVCRNKTDVKAHAGYGKPKMFYVCLKENLACVSPGLAELIKSERTCENCEYDDGGNMSGVLWCSNCENKSHFRRRDNE